MTGTHGDSFENDNVTFDIVDLEGIRLSFRVGTVFEGDEINNELGIWLFYSNREGFFETSLISKNTFDKLVDYINGKFVTLPGRCYQ